MIIPYYQTHSQGRRSKPLEKNAEAGRATAQPASPALQTRRENHPIKTFGGKRK